MQLTMANTVLSDVMLAVHGRGSVARADSTCADAVSSLEFVLAPMLAPILTLVSSMVLLIRSMRIPGKLSCRCSPSRELGPGLNHAHWRRQGLRSISSDFRCVHGTQLVTRENAEKWSCCNKSQPKCSAQVSTPPHKEQQRARRLRWLRRLMQYLAHKQRVPKRARFLRTILAIVRHSDLRARICQKKLAFF